MIYCFIAEHRAQWPVLQVSPSGIYEWDGRNPSLRSVDNEKLTGLIRQSFAASDSTYAVGGSGATCANGGTTSTQRCSVVDPTHRRGQLLQRQFEADAPNRKWLADFTYIWTDEGWLYVAVVLDLFSRRVVGWSMKEDMTSQLVIDALLMAIWRRGKPKELLHHSDQGSQYTSDDFQRVLGAHGIVCSMSRRGDCWDNVAMESSFSTLNTERTLRSHLPAATRRAQTSSSHSTLQYLCPHRFEELFSAAV